MVKKKRLKSNVGEATIIIKLVLFLQLLSILKDDSQQVNGFSVPFVRKHCQDNNIFHKLRYLTLQKNEKQSLSSSSSLFSSATTSTSKKDGVNHLTQPTASIGESIQQAKTISEMLEVASMFWLPTDDNLAPHLKTQAIHHEKRQRWASQLLVKLGSSNLMNPIETEKTSIHNNNMYNKKDFWKNEQLARAVTAATYSFSDVTILHSADHEHQNISVKECKTICDSLMGLHALAGKLNIHSPEVHPQIIEGIQLLLHKAEQIAPTLSLRDATQLRWAARGIITRLVPKLILFPSTIDTIAATSSNDSNECSNLTDITTTSRKDLESYLKQTLPRLEEKVSFLPFDIIPQVVNWEKLTSSAPSSSQMETKGTITDQIRSVIPFQFDTITTRTGSLVTERRGTAWLAEDGIGALAYSGKLMPPNQLAPLVKNVMREIETVILDNNNDDENENNYFDCALCNYYPDEESACKFHTDPEHGTFWERLTCVVAAGEERRFAFRPIAGITTWNDHDPNIRKNPPNTNYSIPHYGNEQEMRVAMSKKSKNGNRRRNNNNNNNNKRSDYKKNNYSAKQKNNKNNSSSHPNSEATSPAVIHLFEGDVVKMWGKCNDDFYHAVYTAEYDFDEHSERDGRVSLVLKRAIDRGKGKKGHGIRGEGRRQKRS